MALIPQTLVERFYNELWNRADEDVAQEILSSDVSFRGSLGDEKQGIDGFLDYMRFIHAALAEYTCTIDDLVVTDKRCAARMTFKGIHQGEFMGVAATGRTIQWSGTAFFTIEQDRIIEVWVLGDVDGIKHQLAGAV